MIAKGIILAGGYGTRLGPLTKATNKQLLPIYDKPLIFYPLSVLMLADIKNILIIVNPKQIKNFKNLLGNGGRFGIKIRYKEQKKPNGLPEAFKIGEDFIKKDNVALILGDNFFYGQGLTAHLEKSKTFTEGALIFLKNVTNPQDYGVAYLEKNKIKSLIEKPKKYFSNKAITGLYYFDNKVIKYAKKLAPSERGETEIIDLLKLYKQNNNLFFNEIGRGALWSDAGKVDDLINIANYVNSYERLQQMKIGCIEEVALKKKWINKNQIKKNIKFYGKCIYSDYLKNILTI
jgi:glucose-1-phosphate thymidylyltransferase